MIAISADQIEALKAPRRRRFLVELAQRARARHPERAAALDDAALAAGLEGEIAAARALGLRTRRELYRFSDLAMTFGFGFSERESWARDLFADAERSPAERLTEVEDVSVFVLRGR